MHLRVMTCFSIISSKALFSPFPFQLNPLAHLSVMSDFMMRRVHSFTELPPIMLRLVTYIQAVIAMIH